MLDSLQWYLNRCLLIFDIQISSFCSLKPPELKKTRDAEIDLSLYALTIVVWSLAEHHELHDRIIHFQHCDGLAVHDG